MGGEVVIALYYDDHGLPVRCLAIVLEWARLHQAELLENWRGARVGERLHRIAPLE